MADTTEVEMCRTWNDVIAAFDSVGLPKRGETAGPTWVFRGHKSSEYSLEPSVEREACGTRLEWKALEGKMLKEFQTKAPLHILSAPLPVSEDKLSWLALMQHYGIPTRLLDFTYSPYVALYFALRYSVIDKCKFPPEVWAIDLDALNVSASRQSEKADEVYAKEDPESVDKTPLWKTIADQMLASQYEILRGFDERWKTVVLKALDPDHTRRNFFNKNGLVLGVLPSVENQRLSSQQGIFLLSGAENITFQVSLEKMMDECKAWCRRFQFAEEIVHQAEARLFQMNIHDLSLFPDVEGLAGFVRQKARLLWGRD
jgi:hypothetical protein